jgi:azurin
VPDDDRIVAATDVIGGGESTSVTFSLDELEDGVDYAYVCTFPGHWSVMRGPFSVE